MHRFANKARRYRPYARLVLCTLATLAAMAAPASAQASAEAVAKRPDKLSPRQKNDAVLAGLDPKKLGQLRAELGRFVAEGQIAGAVTVIGRRGRIGSLEAIGYADREARTRMRSDTVFRIASMTKLITATAVLMLHDEGKLSIDDPVAAAPARVPRAKIDRETYGKHADLGRSAAPDHDQGSADPHLGYVL